MIPPALAAEFVAAGHANHIPPEVLAGVAQIESAMGTNRGPSSAGAIGLMQIMPGTAAGLGVNPHNDRQSIWGAAKLLNQYGYQANPDLALRRYNAGPAGPVANTAVIKYARDVETAARQLAGQLGGTSGSRASTEGASAPASSSGGLAGSDLVRLLLTGTLTAAGGVLAWIGVQRAMQGTPA